MSYDKNTESMLSFILPTLLKDELQEYCSVSDRNQSQVLREAVSEYIRFMKEQQYMAIGVG
jgi:predicted DNA-binding protein